MRTVCVTGSQGFIGSYICQDLLDNGYKVVGIDNYQKYGYVDRPHDKHPNFTLIQQDLTIGFPKQITADYIIACASSIGGISYFHKYAYDLLSTNDRINANTFDYAIDSYELGYLKRIIYISSSMVFENCTQYPSKEEYINTCSMPSSTYGMSKLHGEFYCRGINQQYHVPYNIVRPFNAVGIGEEDAISGNTHVLPDVVYKALQNKQKIEIYGDGSQIRHYTHASDIARGVRLALETVHVNEDFNISTNISTSVIELVNEVYRQLYGFTPVIVTKPGFKHDVQVREPCCEKAKQKLGFEAKISLPDSVGEVIAWMKGILDVKNK